MSTEHHTSAEEVAKLANPSAPADSIPAVDPRLLVREQGLSGYVSEFGRKMKAGDLGSSRSSSA